MGPHWSNGASMIPMIMGCCAQGAGDIPEKLRFREVTASISGITLEDVCWSQDLGMFVGVGWTTFEDNKLLYSYDGENWNIQDLPLFSGTVDSIMWNTDRYEFLVKNPSSTTIVWDNDGTLAGSTQYSPSSGTSQIIWTDGSERYIGITKGSKFSSWSSDGGISWNQTVPIDSIFGLGGIAWSPSLGRAVAVVEAAPQDTTIKAATTTDGVSWSAHNIDTRMWYDVCWAPYLSKFVAVGGYSATSSDGVVWSVSDSPITDAPYIVPNVVIAANNLGLVLSGWPSSLIYSSTDGLNWSQVPVETPGVTIQRMAYSPTLQKCVAFGIKATSVPAILLGEIR